MSCRCVMLTMLVMCIAWNTEQQQWRWWQWIWPCRSDSSPRLWVRAALVTDALYLSADSFVYVYCIQLVYLLLRKDSKVRVARYLKSELDVETPNVLKGNPLLSWLGGLGRVVALPVGSSKEPCLKTKWFWFYAPKSLRIFFKFAKCCIVELLKWR